MLSYVASYAHRRPFMAAEMMEICMRLSVLRRSPRRLAPAACLLLALVAAGPAAAQQADGSGNPSPTAMAPSDPVPDEAAAAGDGPRPAGDAQPGTTAASGLPHDLSPIGMFLAADYVVKGVMGALALASVATWAILIGKTLELSSAKRRARKAVDRLVAAAGLADASRGEDLAGPAAAMLAAAREEVTRSEMVIDLVPGQGVKERVASRLARIEAAAGRRIAVGTGLLATIGSISPFVGLFGTVWGIMNSFIGISRSQTTNLAIVAPGIAEALLATAIGLVAAIPAVVIYNIFARSIIGYRAVLADASSAVERLLSRDLDLRLARRGAAPAAEAGLARSR